MNKNKKINKETKEVSGKVKEGRPATMNFLLRTAYMGRKNNREKKERKRK